MQVPHMIGIEEVDCEEMLAALLEDFVSNFEAVRHDRVFQQLMIAAPPVSTGSASADQLIVATAERLVSAYGLRIPSWVHEEWRTRAIPLSPPSGLAPPSSETRLSSIGKSMANSHTAPPSPDPIDDSVRFAHILAQLATSRTATAA